MNAKLKCCLQVTAHPNCVSGALLLLRLVVGIAFLYHGYGKIQNPMSWMPPDAPVPGILQLLAAVSEFGGGIALILGLLTRIAAFGLGCTMAVATFMHMVIMKDPFVNMTGGSAYELPLTYLCIAILFMNAGPGKFSLDAKIFANCK